jgi:hypothetical protein
MEKGIFVSTLNSHLYETAQQFAQLIFAPPPLSLIAKLFSVQSRSASLEYYSLPPLSLQAYLL